MIVDDQSVRIRIQANVRRLLVQFGAVLILTICIGAHVSELFDRWDNTFQTGQDIESQVVVIALALGAVLAISQLARSIAKKFLRKHSSFLFPRAGLAVESSTLVICVSPSPPLKLRV